MLSHGASYKKVNDFEPKLRLSTDNVTACVIHFAVAVHICFFHFSAGFGLVEEL